MVINTAKNAFQAFSLARHSINPLLIYKDTKSHPSQTLLSQGAVTNCSLFNVFINDIAELGQKVTDIKCLLYADDLVLIKCLLYADDLMIWYYGIPGLLYADDLVLWYSASKKNAQERTESALTPCT
ncbi:unnamed protein product [Rodentolepis nana]|uniref:Reverse transcriptase domain-containing protein n=1 Tax=Rodentolepis nana TaxID=102285 RepID=A0A0R3TV19_RODNA|nr:unnamed protein product [Rodentolepis nana]